MDEKELKEFIKKGFTQGDISDVTGKSKTTVRYWLEKYGLRTKGKLKRSPIWEMPHEEFKSIVDKSKTYTEILKHFGLQNKGRNSNTLKKRLREDGLSFTPIKGYRYNKLNLKDVMVVNSTYKREHLKRRLIKEDILKEICDICGLINEWNGDKLILVLDHINGISNDHRLENLRLLCPNCNSQTPNFCGRNNKKKSQIYYCECGDIKSKHSKMCRECSNIKARKVKNRPSKKQIKKDLEELGSFCAVGRKYNVSDNGIRKWLK